MVILQIVLKSLIYAQAGAQSLTVKQITRRNKNEN